MRILLAVAFVVVTSVAAFTYRDLILGGTATVQRPVMRPELIQRALASIESSPPVPLSASAAREDVALTIDSLAAVDSMVGTYIIAVQQFPLDVPAMTDLAFLYMKHGWFDRAIGPLARAREIDPSNEELRRYLDLALARAGGGFLDLGEAARAFEEMVEMWGMGC